MDGSAKPPETRSGWHSTGSGGGLAKSSWGRGVIPLDVVQERRPMGDWSERDSRSDEAGFANGKDGVGAVRRHLRGRIKESCAGLKEWCVSLSRRLAAGEIFRPRDAEGLDDGTSVWLKNLPTARS